MNNNNKCFPRWAGLPRLIMLCLLIGVIAAGCAVQPGKAPPPDNWFGKDKLAHFGVSAAMAAALTNYKKQHGSSDCEAARIGISVSLAVGAAKETYDKYIKRTYWSLKDFTWDVLGSSIGAMAASGCY